MMSSQKNGECGRNVYLDAVLKYMGLGWSVIPVRPRGKDPLVRWVELQERRASVCEVRGWWGCWRGSTGTCCSNAEKAHNVLW